jgi:TRAP-type transport system small permease protein
LASIVSAYFKLLKALVGILLAAMVVLVFTNVVLRYAFGSGITMSEELARWFFVWLVFLGAIVGLISHSLMIVCSVLLVKGSYVQTLINWKVSAPATGWSVGFFYGIGIVFGLSAILILTYELVQAVLGRTSYEDLIAIRESEEQPVAIAK